MGQISVLSVSVPSELVPGQRFDAVYELGGSSIVATAELRFFISHPSFGTFGALPESYQLPLNGSSPTYRPPAVPITRSIQLPLTLTGLGCFPAGGWSFILRVVLGGQASDIFQVVPVSITGFSPPFGPPCTEVTITGTKFADSFGFSDISNVEFDGVPASFMVDDETTIRALAPLGAGLGPIRVTDSCGGTTTASSSAQFFVSPVVNPTGLTNVSPTRASVGFPVRITGANFDASTSVTFNGVSALRAILDANTLDALVPAGATDGPVRVGSECNDYAVSATPFEIDPYCASFATLVDDSRVDSVRLGPTELLNDDCDRYTDATGVVTPLTPGQQGVALQVLLGSCNLLFDKVAAIFADWNGDLDFADAGEEIFRSSPLSSGYISGTFNVPDDAALGTTRLRIVAEETTNASQVAACGEYDYGETQDYGLEIVDCAAHREMPAGQWNQFSLPCDNGGANTVAEVLGDDLGPNYPTRWAVWNFDAATGQLNLLDSDDPLEPGRAYWVATLDSGQTVSPGGQPNPIIAAAQGARHGGLDVPLQGEPVEGLQNMVGLPLPEDLSWEEVRVVDGGVEYTLDQADPDVGGQRACALDPPDPSCRLSRLAYRWTGAAYEAFDGETPGLEGTLRPSDGFWVRAFKSGLSLRFPATPSVPREALEGQADGWYLRLIAEAGTLRDDGNVLGQLPGSIRGYDRHDLPELAPFGSRFLSIVFPHPDWGERAGDYTSDFRSLLGRGAPSWDFDVISGEVDEVILRWQDPEDRGLRLRLLDHATGESRELEAGAEYRFTAEESRRSFTATVEGQPTEGQSTKGQFTETQFTETQPSPSSERR